MERLSLDWSSPFELKNDVAFIGIVGYNLYGDNFNIKTDTYLNKY